MLLRLLATVLGLGLGLATALADSSSHNCTPSTFPLSSLPSLPGATILSLTASPLLNFTVPATPPLLPTTISNISVCSINVNLTHPSANDTVLVQLWLPLQNYNSRFLSAGGSAWAAGHGPLSLAPYAVQGFAVGVTDAGLDGNLIDPSGWAIKPDGGVNKELLENFASRSVHELAVIGKAITTSFYGTKPKASYFEGCSTGGRQGMVAAQRFPGDFDGIVAASPAIYWTKYVIAELWPQVAMKEEGYFPSKCELDAVREDVVRGCDGLDGVKDGVVDLGVLGKRKGGCKWDGKGLIGREIDCEGGKKVKIEEKLVRVVKKIWEGPKGLWFGLEKGAPLGDLAGTETLNGTRRGAPFFVARDWARLFVEADVNFDVRGLDEEGFRRLLKKSVESWETVIDSSDPDLNGFRNAGGKLLIWHGEADNVIFPQGTVKYYEEVAKRVGVRHGHGMDDFFRLFLAPGVDHCAGGSIDGAGPTNALGQLIDWVEKGKAPGYLDAATLLTAKAQFTRKLCPYPEIAKYDGHGNTSDASSYGCVKRC